MSQATQRASVWTGSQGFLTPSPLVCPSDWPSLHLIRLVSFPGEDTSFPAPGTRQEAGLARSLRGMQALDAGAAGRSR